MNFHLSHHSSLSRAQQYVGGQTVIARDLYFDLDASLKSAGLPGLEQRDAYRGTPVEQVVFRILKEGNEATINVLTRAMNEHTHPADQAVVDVCNKEGEPNSLAGPIPQSIVSEIGEQIQALDTAQLKAMIHRS